MICLAANGFGIAATAKHFPESTAWQTLAYQFEHVPWVGCAFWDLIQPSFMFMVGVSLPFSLTKRRTEGASVYSLWGHAIFRAVFLVLLGIVLRSNGRDQTNFTFMDVVSQIGLGYVFLFLMAWWPRWVQWIAATAILAGYWAWFATYPLPPADVNPQSVGLPADWPMLTGFEAHWQKNLNAARDFDLWFLNLFPRKEPYVFDGGGYQTLNFIPSLVTMLFGVMTGDFIRQSTDRRRVFLMLVVFGILGIASGWALDHFGYCPLVKRIWTPSWTLFSTGITLLMLASFYGIIDGLGWKAWAFPLYVAGMNSIALYIMGHWLKGWAKGTLITHFGNTWPTMLGEAYQPMVESFAVLLMFWLIVYWFYRQRAFIRI
ncbi:DUF5009 domain-containing protein [bacterium]|nr:DUF5009 domain-containing protein [bacterium]